MPRTEATARRLVEVVALASVGLWLGLCLTLVIVTR